MGKRKRTAQEVDGISPPSSAGKRQAILPFDSQHPVSLQIVAGSYDRVLHGLTAHLRTSEGDGKASPQVQFTDNFLLDAHASAIRCLAISPLPTAGEPSSSQKVILASGGTDERINLYHLSAYAAPPSLAIAEIQPPLSSIPKLENPRNRELGSLLHHSSGITALCFPTRSKLMSGAEDNTIAVSRTRDWTVLSTIKAPIPKAVGRPSGDTAPLGGAPSGVNDFAVHPSQKLMISVGKGEKCMRLWNLVTGKKAGVLNFEKDLLQSIGEGKYSSGEGRKVLWNGSGNEFTVAFDRGAVIFGMDSKPKVRIVPSPPTKIHHICYVSRNATGQELTDVLAISTESGCILFYEPVADTTTETAEHEVPKALLVGQLEDRRSGAVTRVKCFEVLKIPNTSESSLDNVIVTGSSDGSIRIWNVDASELEAKRLDAADNADTANSQRSATVRQIGSLVGKHETGNRITCLKAFTLQSSTTESSGDDESEFGGLDSDNAKD